VNWVLEAFGDGKKMV